MTKSIWVEAPARLHLGMFDLNGDLGRRFGGIGVAIAQPSLLIEAQLADELVAHGPYAEQAIPFAQRFLAAHGIAGGASIQVHRAIPQHVGMGSGTQMGLAVARALAELHGLPSDPAALAVAAGRARRSAIGTWAFGQGGFIVEGGRRTDRDTPAPLLMRYAMPEDWRCVVAIPAAPAGLSGEHEVAAFGELAPPPPELVGQITRLVLMLLLPALVEADIEAFGRAITEIQRLVGDCFSPAQGGRFANTRSAELIEALLGWGAAGAGQSSWGPTVYGIVADEQQGQELAERAARQLAGEGQVFLTSFDNHGARIQKPDP
jgi:beta-ribofuranosylaminobenzene 5'-phosphate synthase